VTAFSEAMLRKKKRPWTDQEDSRLLDMIGRERPRTSIAAALGRSVAAITGRLKILRARRTEAKPRQAGDPVP
jgi:hypothetical protein